MDRKNIQIAICDDNPIELEIIKNYTSSLLKAYELDIGISTFYSGMDLLSSNLYYDIILLDVEMKSMNGIEIKKRITIKYKNTKIIFVSNHQDLVLDAFGKNVFAYIDKNNLNKLDNVFNKIIVELLDDATIVLNNELILIKEILYLEADGAYTNIYLSNKNIFLRKNLKEFEVILDVHGFYRVHKSFIINLRFIKNISYSEVELTDNHTIKISRGYHERIKEEHYRFIKEQMLWK